MPEIGEYLRAANQILYRKEGVENDGKYKSHTGSVLYCSIMKELGLQRTYVSWEGTIGGKPGVIVTADHSMMYFFKANKIHKLKLELNG